MSGIQSTEHHPGMETYREKASRKFKENPWVPLGSLATVGALVTAMVKMRRGESQSFNHWLRVRVVAQGLTIVAIVAGTYSMGVKNTDIAKSQTEADAERRRQEKSEKERLEFEGRLRDAERSHEAESGLSQKWSGKNSEDVVKESVVIPVPNVASHAPTKAGWRGWLPWSSHSSASADDSVKDDGSSKRH